MTSNKGKLSFPTMCQLYSLPVPVPEFKFHPTRLWRFDWMFPNTFVAIEIQGGIWISGRHSRGKGQLKDFEKCNVAQCMGYIVLQITHQQIHDGSFAQTVRDALNYRNAENIALDDDCPIGIANHILPLDRGNDGLPLGF